MILSKSAPVIPSDNMADCCKTACKICGLAISLSGMRSHTLSRHDLKITRYKEIYGQFVIIGPIVYHRCHICDKVVLLDNDSLAGHIKGTHKMKERVYKERYMTNATTTSNYDKPTLTKKISEKDLVRFATSKTSKKKNKVLRELIGKSSTVGDFIAGTNKMRNTQNLPDLKCSVLHLPDASGDTELLKVKYSKDETEQEVGEYVEEINHDYGNDFIELEYSENRVEGNNVLEQVDKKNEILDINIKLEIEFEIKDMEFKVEEIKQEYWDDVIKLELAEKRVETNIGVINDIFEQVDKKFEKLDKKIKEEIKLEEVIT